MFIVDGPFLTYFQSVELKFQYCSSKHESLVLILEREKKKEIKFRWMFSIRLNF